MVRWKSLAALALGAGALRRGRRGIRAEEGRRRRHRHRRRRRPRSTPHVTSAQAARNVTLHIYETLYARDENAKPVPELAEGVKISEDGKTYVFPIRKGVKFHNGKELDANDVVASLERYRKVGASASLLAAIDQVKATGPNEVTITLKDVQSTFLDNLSSPRAPIAIYPAEEAAKAANQINFIGTGPFRFVEYKPDSHVKLAQVRRLRAEPEGHAGATASPARRR